MNNINSVIEQSLNEKIKMRLVSHRNAVYRFFRNRYREFLPVVIGYTGLENTKIDPIQLEIWLRQGYGVAIGETKRGVMILGTVSRQSNIYSLSSNFSVAPMTSNDITYFINEKIRVKNKEITFHDGYETGNMVVIYNKPYQLTNDFEIIDLYSERIAEIALSRFSIYMQAKIATVIRGESDDEDIEQLTQDLYNGSPFIETTLEFDPRQSVIPIDNGASVVGALPELKREYQNNIAELNNILGLSALGVDKASGVSEIEAQSNKAYQKANSNVYLKSRNEKLKLLNDKFNLSIKAEYADEIASELSSLEKVKILEGGI
jgi:hypothetical protein